MSKECIEELVRSWIRSHKGVFSTIDVDDDTGEYRLDRVTLDGTFNLSALVKLVESNERDRCAKIADAERDVCYRAAECECNDPSNSDWSLRGDTARVIAGRIRSGE